MIYARRTGISRYHGLPFIVHTCCLKAISQQPYAFISCIQVLMIFSTTTNFSILYSFHQLSFHLEIPYRFTFPAHHSLWIYMLFPLLIRLLISFSRSSIDNISFIIIAIDINTGSYHCHTLHIWYIATPAPSLANSLLQIPASLLVWAFEDYYSAFTPDGRYLWWWFYFNLSALFSHRGLLDGSLHMALAVITFRFLFCCRCQCTGKRSFYFILPMILPHR